VYESAGTRTLVDPFYAAVGFRHTAAAGVRRSATVTQEPDATEPAGIRDAWPTGNNVPPPPPSPPRRRGLSRGLVTTYFAAGVVLLLAGLVTVVYLSAKRYGSPKSPTTVADGPFRPASASPGSASASVDPFRVRLGPERLAMGKSVVLTGERDAKFQVTVKAGKFHRAACDSYSVKPKNGGYLPTRITVKVLQGEPNVSEYAFRFQKPDGTWLPPVGGSGCETEYGTFTRRLSAGRTYSVMVVYDIPRARKGDIVFVWPLVDVAASWHVG
jgi:hypothetical protein